jgi:hypothetical protein
MKRSKYPRYAWVWVHIESGIPQGLFGQPDLEKPGYENVRYRLDPLKRTRKAAPRG